MTIWVASDDLNTNRFHFRSPVLEPYKFDGKILVMPGTRSNSITTKMPVQINGDEMVIYESGDETDTSRTVNFRKVVPDIEPGKPKPK